MAPLKLIEAKGYGKGKGSKGGKGPKKGGGKR